MPGGLRVSITLSGLARLFGNRLDWVIESAAAADAAGIDQIAVPDHLAIGPRTDAYPYGRFPLPASEPWLEPLTLLAAIAGADPGDPSTADVAVPDYVSGLGSGARGTRIGVVRSLFESDLVDPRVAEALAVALGELRAAGAELTDVRMELLEHFGPIQQCVQFVEATAVHREWLQSRLSDYGEDVRARLLTGLFFPPTVYVLGQRARRLALAAFRDAIDGVDLLVAPASGVLPPRIGEDSVEVPGGGRILYRLTVIPFNSPWSCVGAPAASVPAGFVDGLPVGLSLIGRRFDETTVLHVAHAYQQLTDWHERRPALEAAEVSG
jgi:aspartyl-tRNA(Asn)/glutamyl-tRNA(Gln) amidotransferase subunit A